MMEKETPSTAGDSSSNPTRVDLFSDETVDCIYQAKAHVLNQAIQKIGMGKYQVSCRINYAFFDRSGICSPVVSLCGRRLWLGCVRFYCACVQTHSDYLRMFQRYWSVCMSSFYLRTKCTTTLTPVQGSFCEHPLSSTSRIPIQSSTSVTCDGTWFFRWRTLLGILKRYLGTEVCIPPSVNIP